MHVGNVKAPALLREGKLTLVALVGRTSVTVWAADGLVYLPLPAIHDPRNHALALHVTKGTAKVTAREVHELRSIWARGEKEGGK